MKNTTQYIRVQKTQHYTVVDNQILKNSSLSWKAKGILIYVLSMSNEWNINLNEVIKHATDGKAAFRAGWKELENQGYVKRFPVKDEKTKRIKYWQTIVSEKPHSDFPQMEKPDMEKPDMENRKLTSTNNNKYQDITNTNNNNSRNSAEAKYDDDSPYMILANLLFKEIRKRNPKHKEPNWQSWADDFRKIHKIDDKELAEIKKVLIWSQSDSFWQNNILSPAKFRKQYDQLYLKCSQNSNSRTEYNPDEEIDEALGF